MLINILCLLTKNYIHINKCKDEPPTYSELCGYFKKTYILEMELAKQKRTKNLVNNKWRDCEWWITPSKE